MAYLKKFCMHAFSPLVVILILMSFFGITITQVAATQTVPFLCLTLASTAVFGASGIVDVRVGLVLMAGTAVGGYLGAHLAVRAGDRWVRRLFALVVVAHVDGDGRLADVQDLGGGGKAAFGGHRVEGTQLGVQHNRPPRPGAARPDPCAADLRLGNSD